MNDVNNVLTSDYCQFDLGNDSNSAIPPLTRKRAKSVREVSITSLALEELTHRLQNPRGSGAGTALLRWYALAPWVAESAAAAGGGRRELAATEQEKRQRPRRCSFARWTRGLFGSAFLAAGPVAADLGQLLIGAVERL